MADRLEMHVLAVGQGSCGLVARYDSSNQLVQLDLSHNRHLGGMSRTQLDPYSFLHVPLQSGQ